MFVLPQSLSLSDRGLNPNPLRLYRDTLPENGAFDFQEPALRSSPKNQSPQPRLEAEKSSRMNGLIAQSVLNLTKLTLHSLHPSIPGLAVLAARFLDGSERSSRGKLQSVITGEQAKTKQHGVAAFPSGRRAVILVTIRDLWPD